MNIIFDQELNASVAMRYTVCNLRIDEIAKDLGISERQLQRKSKKFLDMSPVEYLRKYRLFRSKELLDSESSIASIGFKVGFTSHSYFARCFKKEFGYTASQYVMEYK